MERSGADDVEPKAPSQHPRGRTSLDHPRRQPPRHLSPRRALHQPDRHAGAARRHAGGGVQRGALPDPPRQRPDPDRPVQRRRAHLVGARGRAALDRHHRQLGLRHLRARRRDLAGQHDHHRLLQARREAGGRLLEHRPGHRRMGRLELDLQDQGLARHLRGQVEGPRQDLERSDPGQRAPAQARRLPARLLAAAVGLDPDGPLRPHPRLRGGRRGRDHPLGADALRRWRRQLGILLDPRLRPGLDHRLRGAVDAAAEGRPAGLVHAHPRQSVGRYQEHGVRGLRGRRLQLDAAEVDQHLGLPGRDHRAAGRPLPDDLRLSPPALRRARRRSPTTASPGT